MVCSATFPQDMVLLKRKDLVMSTPPAEVKKPKPRKLSKKAQLNLFEPTDKPDQQVTYSVKVKAKAKPAKKLGEYKHTRPPELKLFELLASDDKQYSNTIELYDFIPKHFWGKVERINEEFLRPLEREFECRGAQYKVIITPARIKEEDGKFRDYYPGRREEFVEAALRKLACDGRGAFLDDSASVVFSLNELQSELKRRGHTYSIAEIKEALLICVKTSIEVKTEDGKAVLVSGIFENLGLRTWDDWQEQGQQTRCFVRLNCLVTDSIKNGTFRQLNYEKFMSFKHTIARQLYKRLSHHYIQASMANTYEIMLSTLIRDFGLTVYDRFRNNLLKLELALEELADKNVILEYKIQKTLASDRQHKLIDAKIIIRPHPRFSGEMIKANERHKQVRSVLATRSRNL